MDLKIDVKNRRCRNAQVVNILLNSQISSILKAIEVRFRNTNTGWSKITAISDERDWS